MRTTIREKGSASVPGAVAGAPQATPSARGLTEQLHYLFAVLRE